MATKKDWNKIIGDASQQTQQEFAGKLSSIVKLTDSDILKLIDTSTINQQDLASLLSVLHNASLSNEQKAQSISNIKGGVDVIVKLASQVL